MKPRRRRNEAISRLIALGLAAGWFAASTADVQATLTDPFLSLTRGVSETGSGGIYLRLDGSFPASDLVQLSYPLQVLVREVGGTDRFVRFDLSAGAVRGSLALLSDGLDAGDVATLMATGSPEPSARILGLGPDRIEVMIPADFPAGPAELQLFVIDEGDVILSNPVSIVIVGPAS